MHLVMLIHQRVDYLSSRPCCWYLSIVLFVSSGREDLWMKWQKRRRALSVDAFVSSNDDLEVWGSKVRIDWDQFSSEATTTVLVQSTDPFLLSRVWFMSVVSWLFVHRCAVVWWSELTEVVWRRPDVELKRVPVMSCDVWWSMTNDNDNGAVFDDGLFDISPTRIVHNTNHIYYYQIK